MTDPWMTPEDADLATALRGLAADLAWPDAGAPGRDVASRVRVAIVATPQPATRRRARTTGWRRWRRPLILALAALLALAAVAGAVGLGLPGLRLTLGPPTITPPPITPVPSGAAATAGGLPGSTLHLGRRVEPDDVVVATGHAIPYPTDPRVGSPDAIWVDHARADQVALVWGTDDTLPPTLDRDIGLIVMSFDGSVGPEFYEKAINGGTTVEPVTVAGHDGFWVSGDPHVFFYSSANGFVDDPRRWVGDALIWSDGARTWRIESALGRDATIEIAESIAVGS
jgi:hypothetical protein